MKGPRFGVYKAKDGWRWRLLAGNNRKIAESGEAYTREGDAWRAIGTVVAAVIAVDVVPAVDIEVIGADKKRVLQ